MINIHSASKDDVKTKFSKIRMLNYHFTLVYWSQLVKGLI